MCVLNEEQPVSSVSVLPETRCWPLAHRTTLRRPFSFSVCGWCCVCTLPIFLGDLLGFAFLLSDARFQRGALARSILCAQHGHSVGSPGALPTRAEAPSSSHSADEEPRLRQAESAAAIGSAGPGTHCLPRHRLPTPFPWAWAAGH